MTTILNDGVQCAIVKRTITLALCAILALHA